MLQPNEVLIAPCGMNCGICSAYLAHAHNLPKKVGRPHCAGCRTRNKQCALLKKRCEKLAKAQIDFCYQCVDFPCHGLRVLDRRYQEDYQYSPVQNLELVRDEGVRALLAADAKRFKCTKCGDTKSVHNGKCYGCQTVESWKG